MDLGFVYMVLYNNQLKIGFVYMIDGCVKGFGIVLFEDDKYFFLLYNVMFVVCKGMFESNLKFVMQFNVLLVVFDNDVMQVMVKVVDFDGKLLCDVVDVFLCIYLLF